MSAEPQSMSASVDTAHPLIGKAVESHRNGRLDEAAELYLKILAESPLDFDAMHLLGVVALQQGRFEAAQGLINKALGVNPHDVAAMGNLGNAYMRDGQLQAATHWFEMASRLQPDSVNSLTNLGTALHHLGRTLEAIPHLRRAYEQNPRSYAVCNFLGACLIKSGDPREAADMFEQATIADPANAEGWANLSVALNATGEHERARTCADRAVQLQPESSTAFGALGAAQVDQGKLADAIESYRKGVALPDPSPQMLLAFGNALLASGFNEEAIKQLHKVVQIDPKSLNARWAMVIAHLKAIYASEADLVDSRRQFSSALDEVAAWYRQSVGIVQPFDAVGISQPFYLAYHPYNNREMLSRYGALCVSWMTTLPSDPAEPSGEWSSRPRNLAGGGKIRVGIASSHIHEHSVWNAITKGWVQHLDADSFELYLFQLSPTSDQETDQARRIAAHFEDRPTHLGAWVEAIRRCALDVLIYPEIGMDPLTVRLAALRLAPVQAASWGHPETSGLPTVDLYLSAAALEPADAQHNYSEKLVRLPNLGVYVEPLSPATTKLSLQSLSLPRNEPLLLCPGSPFKYTPLYDDVWVEIARGLRKRLFKRGGGRLVFFRSRSDSMDRMLETRLRTAFIKGGLDFDERVSIISNLDRAKYFALMRKSTLLLDTIGFSGFNTALQAIECDLPVLAFEGEFMRGRLASAILRHMDIPELVATSKEDFISKAVELANDGAKREGLRAKIMERRDRLFRDLAPVRALEQALKDAVESELRPLCPGNP